MSFQISFTKKTINAKLAELSGGVVYPAEEETEEAVPMMRNMKAQAPTKLTVQPGDEFRVVYAVDTRFMGTGKWATILESISGSAKEIFKRSPKATVYLLEQNMPHRSAFYGR